MLELQDISAGYGKNRVLHHVSTSIRKGELTAILGPNGCGKSTLLKTALGILHPTGGKVILDGIPLAETAPGNIARRIAWLPQEKEPVNMTAEQLVLCGRFPHLNYPRRYRKKDREIAMDALRQLGIAHLAHQSLHTLSGGQRQSVYVAMALAQDADYILLDEPTAYLDVSNSFSLMAALKELARQGKGIAVVLHDLPLAMEYADNILILEKGSLVAQGTPETVYTTGVPDSVFGIRLEKTGRGYLCRPK